MKRESIGETASGRVVWRFTFDRRDDVLPELVDLPTSMSSAAVANVLDALGVGKTLDPRRVRVAELADVFDGVPRGSACAWFHDGQGRAVLHVVGEPVTVAPEGGTLATFDADNVPDGRPGLDKLLTREAVDLALTLDQSQAAYARMSDERAALQEERDEIERLLDAARAERDELAKLVRDHFEESDDAPSVKLATLLAALGYEVSGALTPKMAQAPNDA